MVRVSSETPDKKRWTELELSPTDDGWKLTVIGETVFAGEWVHVKHMYCDSPEEVLKALTTRTGTLSGLANQLLDLAGQEYEEYHALSW